MSFVLILQIILIGIVILTIYGWTSLAPWLPTKRKDLPTINELATLKEGQTFVEMGCGNGRVCAYIAKHNPNVHVVGIELGLGLYMISRLRALRYPNLKIQYGDALNHDCSKVDVVYVFGLTKTMNGVVKEKMLCELKPGASCISYLFVIDDWPGTIKKVEGGRPIYRYTKR